MSYPPGQQPPTWGGQQQPPTWGQPPQHYSVPPRSSGTSPLVIVIAFIGILLLIVGVAGGVILLSQSPAPEPPCVPERPCAPGPSLPPIAAATATPVPARTPLPSSAPPSPSVPPSGAPTLPPSSPGPTETPASISPPVILGGSTWRSATLDYGFEFDAELFSLTQSTDTLAVLELQFLDATVVVEGTTADVTPSELIERELAVVDGSMIGRTKDTDDYDALLGPSLGYISGEGGVYSGILTSSDGTPVAPGGVTIMASTNGRVTVAVVVIVGQPDTLFGSDTAQYSIRSAVDDIVKSFDWGGSI